MDIANSFVFSRYAQNQQVVVFTNQLLRVPVRLEHMSNAGLTRRHTTREIISKAEV